MKIPAAIVALLSSSWAPPASAAGYGETATAPADEGTPKQDNGWAAPFLRGIFASSAQYHETGTTPDNDVGARDAVACLPAYLNGGSYAVGDTASARTTTAAAEEEWHNYHCASDACGLDSRAPGGPNWGETWIREEDPCEVTESNPTPIGKKERFGRRLRRLMKKVWGKDDVQGDHRALSTCYGDHAPQPAWHPVYSAGWTHGFCRFGVECHLTTYSTELECCKNTYRDQLSGFCIAQLPNPPTMSPTDVGGPGLFYPDYSLAWPEGRCTNTRPIPSGRPTYTSELACCKAAYAGQLSGKCIASLPSPPTSSPTNSAREADFWYPDYDTPWPMAGCSNKLPLPFNNRNDRPNFATNLECCKASYAGQTSGACLRQLPNPPTTSPTGAGGADFFYPDYETSWAVATCINTLPLPFTTGGRPTFSSKAVCCSKAYAGQVSNACVCSLDEPPSFCFETETIVITSQVDPTALGLDITLPLPTGAALTSLVATVEARILSFFSNLVFGEIVSVTVLTIGGVNVQTRRLRQVISRALQQVTDVTFELEAEITCLPEECAEVEAALRDEVMDREDMANPTPPPSPGSTETPTPAPTPAPTSSPTSLAPTFAPVANSTVTRDRHLAEEQSNDSAEDQLDEDACNRVLEPRLNGYSPEDLEICLKYESLPLIVPECNARSEVVPQILHTVSKNADQYHPAATSTLHPTFEQNHHSDASALEYVRAKCGSEAAMAYSCFNPPSFRADLFRFCALYADGGVYLDADIVPVVPLEHLYSPCSTATIGHDFPHFGLNYGGKQMKILASAPGAPIFKCAMETIIQHVRARYMPKGDLMISGPTMLQKCYDQHSEDVAITYHDTRGARWPYTGMRAGDTILAYELPGVKNFKSQRGEKDESDYNYFFEHNNVYSDTCKVELSDEKLGFNKEE